MPDEVEIVQADQRAGGDDADGATSISEPGKLLRIALMLREMQEEVRRAPTDDAGRQRLRRVHDQAIEQLRSVLSEDLQGELDVLTFAFDEATPSESEILIAQAQLIGWLEGLFQGIQAAIFNQQLQARQQLEQMRQRGLPPGSVGGADPRSFGVRPQQEDPGERQPSTGHYL